MSSTTGPPPPPAARPTAARARLAARASRADETGTARWRFAIATGITPESAEIGARLVENMTSNLLFIGTVLSPNPIYHRNALKNFPEFKTASYEYYRTYPYRASQWFFEDGK